MGNCDEVHTSSTKDVLSLEIQKRWSGRDTTLAVVVSRPGLEGAYERRWRLVAGVPDSHQADDLAAWVLTTVKGALAGSTGIQGLL